MQTFRSGSPRSRFEAVVVRLRVFRGRTSRVHGRGVPRTTETSGSGTESGHWHGDLLPSEVLRRNFFFCSIDDPSAMAQRHHIGVENIMLESDYPHADSTWPDTQSVFAQLLAGLPDDEVHAMTHGNAARLFRHPLPPPGSPHGVGVRG